MNKPGRHTNAVVMEDSLWAKKGEEVNVREPYEDFPPGRYKIEFRIKTQDNSLADIVASVRVQKASSGKIFNRKEIKGKAFSAQNNFESFSLIFEIRGKTRLEFPIHFEGIADMWLEKIRITNLENTTTSK